MKASRLLSLSPSSTSYNSCSSVNLAEIAARVVREFDSQEAEFDSWSHVPDNRSPPDQNDEVSSGTAGEDDFEFAFVCSETDSDPVATADEIFHNGQIRPLYPFPLFNSNSNDDVPDLNRGDLASKSTMPAATPSLQHHRPALRKLMREERDSEEADELSGVRRDTYCVWTPRRVNAGSGDDRRQEPSSPSRQKIKSNSSGSSRWWKLRDLLYVKSNGSDGKQTFVFLEPIKKSEKPEDYSTGEEEKPESPAAGSGGDSCINRNRSGRVGERKGGKPKRRSYLPYRMDLMGILGNVHVLNRNLHPF